MPPACSIARHERVGHQQPELRMLPAHERLDAVRARACGSATFGWNASRSSSRSSASGKSPTIRIRRSDLSSWPESIDGARLVTRERVRARARRAPAELRGIAAVLGKARDARRRLQRDVRTVDAHTGAQQVRLVVDPLRRLLGVEARQADHELLAAEVAENLTLAHALAEHAGRVLHRLLARAMAERRDDAVEAVEREAHDAHASWRLRSRRAAGSRGARGSAARTCCRDALDGRCAARDRRSPAASR